jgi:hypothetical protein
MQLANMRLQLDNIRTQFESILMRLRSVRVRFKGILAQLVRELPQVGGVRMKLENMQSSTGRLRVGGYFPPREVEGWWVLPSSDTGSALRRVA